MLYGKLIVGFRLFHKILAFSLPAVFLSPSIKIPSCRALQQPGTKRGITGEEQAPDPVAEVIVDQGGDRYKAVTLTWKTFCHVVTLTTDFVLAIKIIHCSGPMLIMLIARHICELLQTGSSPFKLLSST